MRIAFDATTWDAPLTGLSLLGQELAAALVRQGQPVEAWGRLHAGDVPRGRMGRSFWTLSALPLALAERAPDVYHAHGNFNLPLKRPPQTCLVLTVADLIPLLLPDTCSLPFRLQFRVWLSRALKVAHRVICISHTTAAALRDAFPEAEVPVTVIYPGVDHIHRTTVDATTERYVDTLALPERFVCQMGSLDPRKNIATTVAALELLASRGHRLPLVLIGQRWFGSNAITRRLDQASARGVSIRWLGHLGDAARTAVLRRASVFAFPSLYEGFGLPPAEALSLGVPTLISTAGSLQEVCGPDTPALPPQDIEAWAEGLLRMWTSATPLAPPRGKAWVDRYTWDEAARRHLAVYAQGTT